MFAKFMSGTSIRVVVLVFASCFSGVVSGIPNDNRKGIKVATKMKKSIDQKTKKELEAVLAANDALHDSFYKYNTEQVASNAKKLHDMIANITHPEISKLLKYSSGKLLEITAAASRDHNNKNFHIFSMALIHVLRSYDTGLKHEPYYCPMVKMKWVQNPEKMPKVHNPYAPEMPHCGGKDGF